MHEISVLAKACDLAENAAKANHVDHISYMRLEAGELTGYLPVFFRKYYPIITEDRPILKGSDLILEEKKGEAMCNACHTLYNVMANKGMCPRCGSRSKTILSGQDFKIIDIGVEENPTQSQTES
jgi:hydrogenase nickel incorporation protein HypA/HybF